MAAKLELPSVLVDFSMYADGHGLIGKTPKVKLPELEKLTEEYIAGGMASAVDIDMAAVNKMTSTVTLAEPNPDVFKLFGLLNGDEKAFTFRGAMRGKNGVKPFKVDMQARITKLNMSEIERKQVHTTDMELSISVLKIYHDGVLLIHVDAEAGILSVDGKNLREEINNALGI